MSKFIAIIGSLAAVVPIAILSVTASPVIPRQSFTETGSVTFGEFGPSACGFDVSDANFATAVSPAFFNSFPGYTGADPTTNPLCGQQIIATYEGKSVEVEVVDMCSGCATFDLQFTPAAFEQLADFSVGRLHGVIWLVE